MIGTECPGNIDLVPNETSYLWIDPVGLTPTLSCAKTLRRIMGAGSKNKYAPPPVTIFQTEPKMNWNRCCPSYAFSLHQVWIKSRWRCPNYISKCGYIQDGCQAAIMNDIKNLFDVHNPEMPLFLYLKEFLYFQHLPKFKKNTIDLSIT